MSRGAATAIHTAAAASRLRFDVHWNPTADAVGYVLSPLRGSLIRDEVHKSTRNDNNLADRLSFELTRDAFILFRGIFDGSVVRTRRNPNLRSNLAIHLDRDFDFGFGNF